MEAAIERVPGRAARRAVSWPWPRRLGGWVVVVAGLYTAAFVAWVLVHTGGVRTRTVVSDAVFLPLGLAAAAMAWRAAAHPAVDAATKRAWRLMGGAFFAWWCGDTVWFFYEVVRHRQPFPSWADAGYLAFYPLLMWGLLTLPGPRRSALDRLKLFLDAGIVFVAGGMAVWYLVIDPTVRGHEAHLLNKVLSVAYPVGDLVVLFAIALVLVRRSAPASGAALRLLVVAVVSFVVADVAYAHLSLSDSYQGGDWPDAFWLVAIFLFLAGASRQRQLADQPSEAPPAEIPPLRISKLPYVALAFGYGILIWVGGRQAVSPLAGLLIAAVALTIFVAARQLTAQHENLRLTAALVELATTDSLTGLRNRRSFFDVADREWARAGRNSEPLSAVMLDVDHFKHVNDGLGHGAGDEVLAAVARRCEEQLRNVDVLGRYGGDELVALLPDTPAAEALAVAERLRAAVAAEPVPTQAGPVLARVSVGVATCDAECPSLLRLMGRADAALYAAKHGGRDRAEAWCPGMALSPT